MLMREGNMPRKFLLKWLHNQLLQAHRFLEEDMGTDLC